MRTFLFVFVFAISIQASAVTKVAADYLGIFTDLKSTQDQDSTEAGVATTCPNCVVGIKDVTRPSAQNNGPTPTDTPANN